MSVWGADFDYVPTGYIAPMVAELVLQELEKREYIYYDVERRVRCSVGDWKTLHLPLPFSSHFMAFATIEKCTDGLKGHVSLFSLDNLLQRANDLREAERSTAAEIEFLVPYGFAWDAEGLFFLSDGPVDDRFAEHLARDLILATEAGTVSYTTN